MHPGASEICDRRDNQCNGQIDEGLLFDMNDDGIGDTCDVALGKPDGDFDGDGVSNQQEITDSTDPRDPGSRSPRLNSPVYSLWNGFLDMTCILELVNNSAENIAVDVSLYSIDGSLGDLRRVYLSPAQQFDVILNDMKGFQRDSYGLVKIEYNGQIDGRVFYYRRSTEVDGYDFAFGIPLSNPSFGTTAVGFNTFQPSLKPAEFGNLVANWLSIVNLDSVQRGFTIDKYDQFGSLLSTSHVFVPAFGRIDVDGGHVNPGSSYVGMNVITPDEVHAPYLGQLIRYGYADAAGTTFNFAFPLVAVAGNGQRLILPMSNSFSAQNWLEIVNTRMEESALRVNCYNNRGDLIRSDAITLGAHSQQHINASALLSGDENGSVEIIPAVRNSVIAQSMYYFRAAADGGMVAMYGSQAREALGQNLYGTYNLFLNMLNTLRLINPTDDKVSLKVTVNHQMPPVEVNVDLPPHGVRDLALDRTDQYGTERDTYGVVTVGGAALGQAVAEMIRSRLLPGSSDLDYRTPTEIR